MYEIKNDQKPWGLNCNVKIFYKHINFTKNRDRSNLYFRNKVFLARRKRRGCAFLLNACRRSNWKSLFIPLPLRGRLDNLVFISLFHCNIRDFKKLVFDFFMIHSFVFRLLYTQTMFSHKSALILHLFGPLVTTYLNVCLLFCRHEHGEGIVSIQCW